MPRSFDNGVWTSELASRRAEPFKERNRNKVLFHLDKHGPSTDEAIQESLSMSGNSQRPARRELVKMGLVTDSGMTRPTRAGNPAIVWMLIKPKGGAQ
jgi:predicted ArsR family transcriptional regulator